MHSVRSSSTNYTKYSTRALTVLQYTVSCESEGQESTKYLYRYAPLGGYAVMLYATVLAVKKFS